MPHVALGRAGQSSGKIIMILIVLLGYFFCFTPTVFCESAAEGTFPVLHEWKTLTEERFPKLSWILKQHYLIKQVFIGA
jgi:hypothetical protein